MLPGSTTNAAVLNFTRGVSRDLAGHGIRINAISPGLTDTNRAAVLVQSMASATGKTVEDARTELTRSIPLGRIVDPAEIAAMAVLLVSDRTRSMTGGEVIIDGGQMPSI
jgi:3-oxoacyl-[acyl-carrier protein] reductase/bacilysin biosynthesis oxidoreductase BacG